MRLFRHTIHIARPSEAVFDFFIDFSQAARWRQYVRTMVPVQSGPLRTGSHIHVTMDVMGKPYEFDLEVLLLERPTRWRHRTNESDFNGFIEYRFEPEDDGTRVTMTMEVWPRGIYGWLGLPLLFMRREQPYAEQLPQLKRVMEE